MKILQIGKFYPIRGGVEKVMYDLTLGLSALGVHCDMLCATTEEYPAGNIRLNDFGHVIAVKTQVKLSATMIAPAMITKLRNIAKQYDIIHIHHPDPMASLALYLSGYKGKVVLHWHSDILKQKMLLKLYRPLQSWLIRRADKIVGTTPIYVKKSEFLKNVQSKIDFIPIGVEPIKGALEDIDKIKKINKDRKIIFSLGRLVSYKGYSYLVESAKHLPDDYIVLIGGTGPLKDELSNIIDFHQLHDKVKLLGYVSDEEVNNYFEACDLFCLSSILKTEAFAIVQIEAMSCGKPIVSTNIPGSGVSWVNKNEESGLIVPIEDPLAIATAIQTVLGDTDNYQKYSKGAKNRYEQFFTRKNMIDTCLKIYHSLFAN